MKVRIHENEWPWGSTAQIVAADGCAIVEMSFEKNEPGVCYVSGLSVVPIARRQGRARELMGMVLDECRERGIFRIDLNAVKEPFVVRFYESLGFKALEERNGLIPMYKLF